MAFYRGRVAPGRGGPPSVLLHVQVVIHKLAGPGAVLMGLGIAALRAGPSGVPRPGAFIVVNGLLILGGGALVGLALLERRGRGPPAQRATTPPARGSMAWGPMLGVVAGTLLAAIGYHLALVCAGAIVTAWSGWLLQGSARVRYPVGPALTLILLPAFYLLRTIAGPVGLAMPALREVPLSPAAEQLVSPAVLLVAYVLGGLWPFHRHVPGAWTASAGALLLFRVGWSAFPSGLAHWQTAVFPLLALGMWHAAWTRRLSLVAVGGALLGVASLDPRGLAGAPWLLAAAIALELPLHRRGLIAAGLGAWGGIEVATGGLRTETVYTVLAAAAVAVALIPPTGRSIFGPTKTG